MKPRVEIVGLDLSLRNSAVVCLPENWKPGDWRSIKSMTVGYGIEGNDPFERARRLHNIAEEIADWVGPAIRVGTEVPIHVYVEDLAYGLAAARGMMLAELSGAVKAALFGMGHGVIPVNQSTARKYLLGKLPPKDRVKAVHVALKEWGSPFTNGDEADAFVIANYARTEHGLPGLTLA